VTSRGRALVLALACGLAAVPPARAHDSWLTPAPAARGSAFAFSTGTRYPVADVAPPADSVVAAGCVDALGQPQALQAGAATPTALALHTAATGPLACWAELRPFDITLAPRIVEVYLREIQPAPPVREAWAAQQELGMPWVERYRKFARVEHGTAQAPAATLRQLREPRGLPLEIVVTGESPLRAGEPAAFQVLAQGSPVAGLAVELVSERSRFGVWARTDAQGRLQHRLPFAGAWLLRATLVEPDVQPGHWRSRFATLAFEAS
jgi:hypothetical protein